MNTMSRYSPILLPPILVACGVSTGEDPRPVSSPASTPAASVTPVLYEHANPTCSALGYAYSAKADWGNQANQGWGCQSVQGGDKCTIDLGNGYWISFTYDANPTTVVDWESNLGIDAVIVKGGDNANVYEYNPESLGDTGLVTPLNDGKNIPALSHVDFCYDWEVKVEKTADTSYKRSFSWDIDKTGSVAELLLTPGQTYTASYDVTVSVSGATDSDWAVAGTITVTNPDPKNTAHVVSLKDVFGGNELPVSCSVTFPVDLAPGASFSCTYQSALTGAIDGTNVATAETTGLVGSGEGSAAVAFGAPTTLYDACVTVDDDKYGALGTVCQDAAPKTFSYNMNIGPYAACGSYQYDNTASFETNDSGSTDSDSWSVTSEVPCVGGCSLTQGYWKTHSSHGPAPYDDNWAQIPGGADAAFFISGQSYYEVLWTAPQGNAYYNLAHQYIAAKLNGLNGADTSAIASALATAESLLSTYTPAQIVGLKGKQKTIWIAIAGMLDSYNNGLIGPGHCSE